MEGLNGKCGDEIEMMIVKNIPSSVFPSLFFFFFFFFFFFLKENM